MQQVTKSVTSPGEIGQTLKLERLQSGLKQGDVAQASGLTVWRLLKIEQGKAEATDTEVAQIKAAIKRLGAIEVQRQVALRRGR